jgi:hypothetical protein
MILGHRLDLERLRAGVEHFWWPRQLDGRLSVAIEGLEPPDPRSRSDLSGNIRAWEIVREELGPGPLDRLKAIVYKERELGMLALTSAELHGSAGSPTDLDAGARIAMIREPGMVVQYLQVPTQASDQPGCQGVFLASNAMNSTLAASEPPQHDRWDAETTRRDRELSPADRSRISQIYRKTRSEARTFLREHQEPPPEPPGRCRELEKMLGAYLATDAAGPQDPPDPAPDPFEVRFLEAVSRTSTSEGIVLDTKVSVATREEITGASVRCRASAWVDTIVDRGGRAPRSERVQVPHLQVKGGRGEIAVGKPGDGGVTSVEFRGTSAGSILDLRSAPLPHVEYGAELQLVLELVV